MTEIVKAHLDRYAERVSQAELFHEASALHDCDTSLFQWIDAVNTSPDLGNTLSRPSPSYFGHVTVALPPSAESTARLDRTIFARCSDRNFPDAPLEFTALGRILRLGNGISHELCGASGVWSLRTTPSGGALYPIELHVVARNVAGLDGGHYFYDVPQETLCLVSPSAGIESAFPDEVWRASYAACILLVATARRSSFKYGERAYRFILLEAGHIAQNMLLAAASAEIPAFPVGGFIDGALNEALGFDGVTTFVSYAVFFGGPAPERGTAPDLTERSGC